MLYPSVTLSGAKMYGKEPELQIACVRAYNEWLAEFCEGSDGRLIGQGILPTTGVDDAIAETERALALSHRGVVISAFPNGSLDAEPDDDRFWAFVQDADIPVAVHIGSFLKGQSAKPPAMDTLAFMGVAGASKAGAHTIPVVCDLIFSGIFERFTDLKLLLVEANIGWIPTLLEQVDDMFLRYRWFTNGVEQMPTTAEPDLPPQLLGHVHDRHGRHRAAAPDEPRSSPLVDGLPPHRHRLAQQPGHHRA